MRKAIAAGLAALIILTVVWWQRGALFQAGFTTLRQADREAMCIAAIHGAPPVPQPLSQKPSVKASSDFAEISIARRDGSAQPALFHPARGSQPAPLLVSLHTWSGNYGEPDAMAFLAAEKGLHYIHPDFGGGMTSPSGCCGERMAAYIDDAIDYAIQNAKVDPDRIYLYGVSGGGYAALCALSKSRHRIAGVSVWAPITDLEAWYYQSSARRHVNPRRYDYDILACTGSKGVLDREEARARSPLFLPLDRTRTDKTKVQLYAGITDGMSGSVPVTHAMRYYNKLADDTARLSDERMLDMVDQRSSPLAFQAIGGRPVYLNQKSGLARLVIFEGGHEGLPKEALDRLLEE